MEKIYEMYGKLSEAFEGELQNMRQTLQLLSSIAKEHSQGKYDLLERLQVHEGGWNIKPAVEKPTPNTE